MKKKLTVLLALLLCLSMLTGCGGRQSTDMKTEAAQSEGTSKTDTAEAKTDPAQESLTDSPAGETVYQAQYLEVRDAKLNAALSNLAVLGEGMVFTSLGVLSDETPDGISPEWPEQYWTYGPILGKIQLDGTVKRIPYEPEVPEREGGHATTVFEKLCLGSDGTVWIVEKQYLSWNDAPEEMTENDPDYVNHDHNEESFFLVRVREDGTQVSRISLDELGSHRQEAAGTDGTYSFNVTGMAEDGTGRICLAINEWFTGANSYVEDNKISFVNMETGVVEDTVMLGSNPEHMVKLSDGTLAISCFQGGTQLIEILDPTKKEFTSTVPIDDFVTGLAAGEGDFLLYFTAGDSLYGLNPADGEAVKILNWIDCDVAREGNESFCMLPDGRVVTTSSKDTAGSVSNDLIILTPTDSGLVQQKKVLRMAVMNLYPFTSEMVSRFNRSNSEYRIEVTDYSEFNDYSSGNPEDWNAGITRLQTEIIAGDVPDILDISLMSADRLGTKGILEDLYPYMDADPELDRSQLFEHVLSAFEENGKLYQTVGNFYVLTTAGLSSVVGDQMGWTMEQFNEALARLQAENPDCTVFDVYTTRDIMLDFLLYLDMEKFVDWDKGECHFDTDSFRAFLQFVKDFPASFDWSSGLSSADLDQDARLCMGLQMMKQCNFVCFEDVQTNTAGLAGAPCTFVGYPTSEGVGSMFAQIGNSLAITSSCQDKDAAWQFVRLFFLPEYQEQFLGGVFPTNRAVYEKMKQNAMTTQYQRNADGSYVLDAEGKRVEADLGSMEVNGMTYKYHAVTEEEIALLDEIVASTTNILHSDDSLKEIIVEGAAPFFADQRSVDEVAKLIQSKANLYINEQR